MDVHREFAQLAVVEDGIVRDEGKIGVTPEALRAWACELRADDEVALEATGNSDAIATLLTPLVARVVVSNPSKTRAIAEAKVKTRQGRYADLGAVAGGGFPAAGVAAR
jgi:transposase